MFSKLLHFLKYNNAAIIILAIILILGGGALAAGPENIGQRETTIQGIDNTALLSVDLDAFNMDFKIENIEQDEKYYYVTYSYLDLVIIDNAWQYQLSQKTQKASKKIKQDIGEYMAKFMAKHYQARMRELNQEKSLAQSTGEQKRVEVTAYSGLIGLTLDLAAAVFPGYEPIVKNELPAPELIIPPTTLLEGGQNANSAADNLTQIYNDYVAEHPEIFEMPTAPIDQPEAPADSSETIPPEDTAILENPIIPEPESVDIIELPILETPAESAPAPEQPALETPAEQPAPAPEPAPVE